MFDYSPEQCEAIKYHCKNGNSLESFCAKIGVSPKVINDWYQEHLEFKEAVEMCPCLELYYWENQLKSAMEAHDKDVLPLIKSRIDILLKYVTSPIKKETYANFKEDITKNIKRKKTEDVLDDYNLILGDII